LELESDGRYYYVKKSFNSRLSLAAILDAGRGNPFGVPDS